jgi:hypothetical protein
VRPRLELVTFALAAAGYAGLMVSTTLAVRGRRSRALMSAVAAIVVAHVALVWHQRFDWTLARATENGYTGVVLFHAALAGIAAAPLSPPRVAARLTIASFLLVTAGASVAVFRDTAAATFRLPVLISAGAGLASLVTARRRIGSGLLSKS